MNDREQYEGVNDRMYSFVCKGRFDSLDKKLDTLTAAIMGNGKSGLKEEVTILKEHQKQSDSRWKTLLGISSALFVTVVAKLIYDIITHLKQ